jgi:FkbM family methyltransferase
MKKLNQISHRILTSLRYHAEKWKLIPYKYPRRIFQTGVDKSGIWFEVNNITEANRVRFLDDEEEFLSAVLAELKPDDVFYDVGACIGMFALHAARRAKQVIAFEPEPVFQKHLAANCAINEIKNIIVLPYAVSDQSQKMVLFSDGDSGKSPSLANDGFHGQVEVEARTLDDLVKDQGIPYPNVMKMDIEGAEILALRGMQQVFKTHPPRAIFIEIHPVLLTNFGSSMEELLNLLKQSGYTIRSQNERDEQFHFVFDWNAPVAQ